MISPGPIYAPWIGFCLTLVVEFYLVLTVNIRYFKNVGKIQRLYDMEGKRWDYWSNYELRSEMFRHPDAVFDPGDSAAVRLAKEELVKVRSEMGRRVPICIGIMAVGFAFTILFTFLEAYILWTFQKT